MKPERPRHPAETRQHPQPFSNGVPAFTSGSGGAVLPSVHERAAAHPRSAWVPGADVVVDAARRYLQARRKRDVLFPEDLFADPCWDMLLDLFVSQSLGRQVSVSSICIASCVPQSTALRWLARLESLALVERNADPRDGRRTLISLSEPASRVVRDWLASTFVLHDS